MAADGRIVVGCRDASDSRDVFTAFALDGGKELWTYEYEAKASLDYGNSARATPAYADGVVVTLGATGILSTLDATTGVPLWTVDLADRFEAEVPTWGFSGSPLVIGGLIYVQVAEESAFVAIDLFSGETKWQVSGSPAAYASLVATADDRQIIGVDEKGYFVRSADDGRLLWSAEPELSGDFGVPTPVVTRDGVIFTSENNGVQWFKTTAESLSSRPNLVNDILIPDSHTPVLVGDQLLVAHDGLNSLDLDDSLAERWSVAGSIIVGYASIIASENRALVTTEAGDLLLFDLSGDESKLLDWRKLATSGKLTVLSHPAVIEDRIAIRVHDELRCYRFPR